MPAAHTVWLCAPALHSQHSMRRAGTDLTASIAKGYKSPHVNMMAGGGAGMSAMTQDSRKFTGSIMGEAVALLASAVGSGSGAGAAGMAVVAAAAVAA